ncbi:MAG TPA: hypothetical protein VK694_04415 [Verrucomicrobiae bacterium]|nr:hypothetical protein [Verrucomicrobiae bacterium]
MSEFDKSLRTEQFIDADFTNWYTQGSPLVSGAGANLPETLQGFEGQEVVDFETQLADTIVDAHEPRNPYHGLQHSQRTTENAYDAYGAFQNFHSIKLPDGFLQPVLIGTAAHDHAHPGATFFADADPDRVPPGANKDMAVEWYTAKLTAERVKGMGGTVEQQTVAAYIPAASAYGAHVEQGRRLGLDRVVPKGLAGLMMRAVDVVPLAGDYAVSVAENTAILIGEKAAGLTVPETIHEYQDSRKGFLAGYVLHTLDALDEAAKAPLSGMMGWRERVQQRLTENDWLTKDGFSLQRAMLRAQTQAQYNHTLAD